MIYLTDAKTPSGSSYLFNGSQNSHTGSTAIGGTSTEAFEFTNSVTKLDANNNITLSMRLQSGTGNTVNNGLLNASGDKPTTPSVANDKLVVEAVNNTTGYGTKVTIDVQDFMRMLLAFGGTQTNITPN